MTSRPSWVWQVLAAMAGLALFVWLWWKLPLALYRHVGGDARVKAITDTWTALLAGLVGLGAIGTFWLNSRVYKITARTFELTEQGHITERYTKAIEQLGSDKLDVRLGGIYALERIAVDSTRDHPTVVEVLGAYVRQHTDPTQRRRRLPPVAAHDKAPPRPAADVQAALTVLGRLPFRDGVSRGDLAGARLAGADLRRANLTDAWLDRAKLTGAGLDEVDLARADLCGANLAGADLDGTDLTGAWLGRGKLLGADLDGTNLATAKNLTQQQLDSAQGDDETKLPAGRQRLAHWSTTD